MLGQGDFGLFQSSSRPLSPGTDWKLQEGPLKGHPFQVLVGTYMLPFFIDKYSHVPRSLSVRTEVTLVSCVSVFLLLPAPVKIVLLRTPFQNAYVVKMYPFFFFFNINKMITIDQLPSSRHTNYFSIHTTFASP